VSTHYAGLGVDLETSRDVFAAKSMGYLGASDYKSLLE